MRRFGLLMLVLGIAGFLYARGQLARHDPLPSDVGLEDVWDHPAGRWELARYAAAAAAGLGAILALYPRGR